MLSENILISNYANGFYFRFEGVSGPM